MPNTQSAKKALRQNIQRRSNNIDRKQKLKQAVKEFKKLTAAKKLSEAHGALVKVYSTADKVAKSNAISKNKASRIKSRMASLLKKNALQ